MSMLAATEVEPGPVKQSLYVDFPEKDADQIGEVELGKKVTFQITGKVTMVEKRKMADQMFASARIEDYTVSVVESENIFTEMAEEDS